jgi:hypothetical protein
MVHEQRRVRSSLGPRTPKPVPTGWFAANHLEHGTFRNSSPAWRVDGELEPDRAVARLQWRVTQSVQTELGVQPGVALATLLGAEQQTRAVQGRLSGQTRLRPADLEAWSEHIRFPASILIDATQKLPAEWHPVLIRIAMRTGGIAWSDVASQLSELLKGSTEKGASRLLTSASFTYLGVVAMAASGTAPEHIRLVDADQAALHLRVNGRTHHVLFEWAPEGDDARWEDWLYALHGRLARLREIPAAEQVLVAALGSSRLALLDVWSPSAAVAPLHSTLRITTETLLALGLSVADEGQDISLDLLVRQAWTSGELLVLRLTSSDSG